MCKLKLNFMKKSLGMKLKLPSAPLKCLFKQARSAQQQVIKVTACAPQSMQKNTQQLVAGHHFIFVLAVFFLFVCLFVCLFFVFTFMVPWQISGYLIIWDYQN